MTDREKQAESYFKQGYNCSQSVVAVFAPDLGLGIDQALKMSAGFGGGFGGLREVCGAFSGAVMVIGMLYGNTDPAGKKAFYGEVRDVAKRFTARNGKDTLLCRDLLGLDEAGKPAAQPRTAEYYQVRPCPGLVALAVQLVEEYMAEHPLPR